MSEYQLVNQQTDVPPPLLTPYQPGPLSPNYGTLAGTTKVDDPASLKRAGSGALELAGTLHSASRHSDDTTGLAASGLEGVNWGGSLGSTLSQTLDTWHEQADALVRTCRDIHDKCTATADNYTNTESANTQNMSAVRTQSPFG